MGPAALIAVAIGAGFMGMMASNKAVDEQVRAAQEAANLQIQEGDRQRKEQNRIAQEKRSERVRVADRQFASMVTAMADSGGGGHMTDRLAGEIGMYEGLDLARIEGNRKGAIKSIHAEQVSARNNALSIARQGAHQKAANFFSFVSNSAMSVGMAKAGGGKQAAAKKGA